MELTILDTSFNEIKQLDKFGSLIWTERYYECGDFEIHSSIDMELIQYLLLGNYLTMDNTDYYMIIEDWEIVTDFDVGNTINITGRSVESILERRIIWNQTILEGNLQETVLLLLNENIIEPLDETRQIPNFIFEETTDPRITELNIDLQIDGHTIYDVMVAICSIYGIGYRIRIIDGYFVFNLYAGEDRSYDQLENEPVIFSTEFENLLSTNYIESSRPLKTYAVVAGEGEGADKRKISVSVSGESTGLDRRELYVDASDISIKTDDGFLTDEEYTDLLTQRGLEFLTTQSRTNTFEGRADTKTTFLYGKHYFIGDIVQIENEYGMETTARVTELIRSQDEAGEDTYPTFSHEPEAPEPPIVDILVEGVRGYGNIDGGMAETIYGGVPGIVGGDAYGS